MHTKLLRFCESYYNLNIPIQSTNDILVSWYKSKFKVIEYYIEDYYRMIIDLDLILNLNISSNTRLIYEHDTLSYEYQIRENKCELTVHKKYKKAKLPFILIEDMHELLKEGIVQNHCVGSYYQKINNGESAIYIDNYDKKRYTLEITIINENIEVIQCRGKFNAEPPKSYIDQLDSIINELNNARNKLPLNTPKTIMECM